MNHNNTDISPRHGRNGGERAGKGRKWLFLVVDFLLLAAIVAAIFFLVLLLTPLNPFEGNSRTECTVLYTVELVGVDRGVYDLLQEGDVVTDGETGGVLGEVVKVDPRAYEYYTDIAIGEGGKYVVKKETSTDKYTITVTLRANAIYREGVGYTADGSRVAVGRSYQLRFPRHRDEGVCITMREE